MESMSTISLLDLPVEIVHYICDYLDILVIRRSFRYVCKQLYAIISTYDRYKLNITSMSVSELRSISHLIQPTSIISLILSNEYMSANKFELFRSNFDIRGFIRLHSLTLLYVEDTDTHNFTEYIRLFQV
jgi:hypothetical protein